jgi:methyl-accepting chemotaxis protein
MQLHWVISGQGFLGPGVIGGAGSTLTMPSESLTGPKRRVLIVSAAIVALIAAAVGVTIWRYEYALSASAVTTDAYHDASLTGALSTTFWHEREAMNEYLVDPDPAGLGEVAGLGKEFAVTTATLGIGESSAESQLRAQAAAGNRELYARFVQVRPAAGTTPARQSAASARLAGSEDAVITPLGRLRRLQVSRAAAAQAAASSAATQALGIGVAAAILMVSAGLGFALFSFQLLSRAYQQAGKLRAALARLSHVLGQIRSASAVLGEVARETRAGASDAVAATSQQSAAVAETSATIEQLATSAGAIADNTRAVGEAAQRAVDTMSDMKEKVEAIAQRALSLGERAQKIGEILELINGITGQTNMLALNAAIEAARAGDAGKGFAVVATEVRKLAQRSIDSTDSISAIVAAVRDETNATIMATEQGTRQAQEVSELMKSAAGMLEDSILATQQQKSAADQVDGAVQQIRTAADQLAAGQSQRAATAERLEALVADLDGALQGDGEGAPAVSGNGDVPATAAAGLPGDG